MMAKLGVTHNKDVVVRWLLDDQDRAEADVDELSRAG